MHVTTDASVFPRFEQVPTQFRLTTPIEQRVYLCDGTLCTWDGPLQDVLSPVCLQENGRLVQQRVGAYPLLTEREDLDVLAAATRAWDQGRGPWPTMSVEARIRAVETFTCRM